MSNLKLKIIVLTLGLSFVLYTAIVKSKLMHQINKNEIVGIQENKNGMIGKERKIKNRVHEIKIILDSQKRRKRKQFKSAPVFVKWTNMVGDCSENDASNILCANPDTVMDYQPITFIDNFRSPCVIIRRHNQTRNVQPYKSTRQHLLEDEELQCLPAVHIMGFSKCGTSDIHDHLIRHQHIVQGVSKEIDWWRKGRPYHKQYFRQHNITNPMNLYAYMKMFEPATKAIESNWVTSSMHTASVSAKTMILESTVANKRGNTVDKIHHLTPRAKMIYIMRDPVDRAFSAYRFRYQHNPRLYQAQSPEGFHRYVLQNASDESLADEESVLGASIYIGPISRALKVLDPSQIMFVKFEDYVNNTKGYIEQNVYPFLNLPPIKTSARKISKRSIRNKSKKRYKMLPETREYLQSLYRPYNSLLSETLRDTAWNWGY